MANKSKKSPEIIEISDSTEDGYSTQSDSDDVYTPSSSSSDSDSYYTPRKPSKRRIMKSEPRVSGKLLATASLHIRGKSAEPTRREIMAQEYFALKDLQKTRQKSKTGKRKLFNPNLTFGDDCTDSVTPPCKRKIHIESDDNNNAIDCTPNTFLRPLLEKIKLEKSGQEI
jgi:hypothetical protein